jgi:hypothetical protein
MSALGELFECLEVAAAEFCPSFYLCFRSYITHLLILFNHKFRIPVLLCTGSESHKHIVPLCHVKIAVTR